MNVKRHIPTIIALAIVTIVAVQLLAVMGSPGSGTSIQEEIQTAEAFCYQAHGDARIEQSQTFGAHGGLHCSANDNGPHLHAYPDDALDDALNANQTNASFDAAAYETEHYPLFGLGEPIGTALLTFGLIGMVVYIGMHPAMPRP